MSKLDYLSEGVAGTKIFGLCSSLEADSPYSKPIHVGNGTLTGFYRPRLRRNNQGRSEKYTSDREAVGSEVYTE